MPRKRISPLRGYGSDKPWTDALRTAVTAPVGRTDPRQRVAIIAERVVKLAMEGNMDAIKEIGDRLEGRAKQSIEHSGEIGNPYEKALEQITDGHNGPTIEVIAERVSETDPTTH